MEKIDNRFEFFYSLKKNFSFTFLPMWILFLISRLVLIFYYSKEFNSTESFLIFIIFTLTFNLSFFITRAPMLIINDKDFITTRLIFKKGRYIKYPLRNITSYTINNLFLKLNFNDGGSILCDIFFYSKKDREFLKQLLAEKVPVKPS